MAQCGSWCLCPVHSWTGKVPLQPSKLEPVTPWHVFWFLISIHDGVYTEETLTFFFLIENRFFSQTVHPDYSFPFLHSSQLSLIFPLPWIHFVSVSSSEWSRPPRDCSQTGQNKIQQEKAKAFHIEAGQDNPLGGKEPQKQENSQKIHLLPLFGVPQNHQANSHIKGPGAGLCRLLTCTFSHWGSICT